MDIEGEALPGVVISETGTGNTATSDLERNFIFKTIQDTCTISFSFIGLEPRNITFSKDSIINIILESVDYSNTKWLTIGTRYDFCNSVFGFQIRNGFDEEPFIHFEDFQDNLLIKIQGQTGFDANYSYAAKIGWSYPIPYLARISIEYSVFSFESAGLFLKDFNLSSKTGYFRNTIILCNLGYQ